MRTGTSTRLVNTFLVHFAERGAVCAAGAPKQLISTLLAFYMLKIRIQMIAQPISEPARGRARR